MRYLYKFLLFLILAVVNIGFASDSNLLALFKKLPHSTFGVKASIEAIDNLTKFIVAPVLSKSGKSYATVNKMGFDVLGPEQLKNNWVITEFLNFSKVKDKLILDIGAGYGNISLAALAKGNKVIANDIAPEHLLNIRENAIIRHLPLDNLFLNLSDFPDNIDFPENSLHAVMLHRVIHFMSPTEIENGLSKVYRWLKPGGKVFIVVMSPQHKQFAYWFLPIYNEKWQQGDKWPGAGLLVEKALPNQAYNLPKFLHVMDDRPLRLALKEAGFEIIKSDFVSMAAFASKSNERDGKEAMGIIALKK